MGWINFEEIFKIIGSAIITVFTILFGEFNVIFISLIILMVIDYVSGVIKACILHKLNSNTGFSGILKKFGILCILCLAHIIDVYTNADGVIYTTVIGYFICNEGISILENLSQSGVKIPQKLKDILDVMNKEEEK